MNKNIFVIGVTCSGKSTYCEGLRQSYTERGEKEPVLLQMGRFFRETIGSDFFVELDNPAAPDATECWVRNMVWNAQTFAYNYGRDVVVDGFPRTPAQFDWLMLSSLISSKNGPVEIVYITVPEGMIADRVNKRRRLLPKAANLLEIRVKKDAAMMAGVYSAITEAVSKGHYPNLIFKELEL